MDALKNIINNVPDWVVRLDELGDQIDKRQVELAAFCKAGTTKSLRNRGSTESLKLKDEDTDASPTPVDESADNAGKPQAEGATISPDDEKKTTQQPSPDNGTPSAVQMQTKDAINKAQARAREVVKKRLRTESVVSDEEGAPSKYRSRTMVVVYYDQYVQTFFEELVKFVSASRNLMRKAKMAAKVAQIRRLAELEVPDDDDDDGDLKPDAPLTAGPASDALPSLRYMSTRRMGPPGRKSGPSYTRAGPAGSILGDNASDAYDELDKGLEYVQGMCEHAAHQFLRDGQCTEEISNIQRRLADTKELAIKEMERVEREEPELLKTASETNKVRTLRPTSMRRELTPAKDNNPPITPRKLEVDAKLEADIKTPVAKTVEVDMAKPLDADSAPIEADDEGIDDMELTLPPRLNYRSTRAMRGPPRQ
ncbi:uncharacterized protein CTRU02_214488 [Colletotrichum truncatum]|uniref:Uncharacterized protein n=1 Tax=Colletotrichum truncatum TaxID=5467 RepID=A0ACC3YEW9_COLTU|nr:uncharacterized protein CTRU02_12158 [Colletotrichum truncatum]KAF6784947.1 hypothetical protein CTRU02_12158 [Colletotrichum truncatum]